MTKSLFTIDELRDATFSPCGRWRYTLTRQWDDSRPMSVWIGLNPSTADEEKDDPTMRRIRGFCKRERWGGFIMLNLFAYRSTDPKGLKAFDAEGGHVSGPNNAGTINRIVAHAVRRDFPVVAAWGAQSGSLFSARWKIVMTHICQRGAIPLCLGTTKSGHPRHPLYVKGDTPLTSFGG